MEEVLKTKPTDFVVEMISDDPKLPETYHMHSVTKSSLLRRIQTDGHNTMMLGNSIIVNIYQLWEDEIRGRIAKAKGIIKNEVNIDLFGEVRHIRQAIVHNNSLITSDFKKVITIEYTKKEDKSFGFTHKQFEKLINDIKRVLKEYSR